MPTVLITGASRGVGAALARSLAPTYDLLLGGRPSADLDSLASSLDGASTFPVELTDHDDMAAATEAITALDALVHVAGVGSIGAIDDTPVEEYRRLMEVNFFAIVELTRQLLPALRTASGHVVIVNSGAGLAAKPDWSAYAATKFAVRAFADSLRAEEPGIRVTTIYPGRIDTDMQRDIVAMEGGDYDPTKFLHPDTVATAISAALTTAADAHPVDIVLRPTGRG